MFCSLTAALSLVAAVCATESGDNFRPKNYTGITHLDHVVFGPAPHNSSCDARIGSFMKAVHDRFNSKITNATDKMNQDALVLTDGFFRYAVTVRLPADASWGMMAESVDLLTKAGSFGSPTPKTDGFYAPAYFEVWWSDTLFGHGYLSAPGDPPVGWSLPPTGPVETVSY